MTATGTPVRASAAPPETGRRRLAARGTVINSAFQVGFGGLNLLKTVIVAGFLTASDFGVWGIVLLAVGFTGVMKAAAVSDKYIQQEEIDQEVAFQKAFSLELIFAALMGVLTLVIAPLLALAYGREEILLPTIALGLILPGLALQAPTWVFYRRMDFLRQRLIGAVDPIVAFAVTVALAIAGAGYWSFVVGLVAGAWAAGFVALAMSPYPLRWRYEAGTMREYVGFSWPLVLAAGAGTAIGIVSLFLGELALGLAGAGAIALAASFSLYTDSVDRIITMTIYPAVCRVRDNRDLMLEAFTKSNRLTLIWGMPFGIGLALFAPDLVHFGIGDEWEPAIVLIEVFGVAAAVNHIGFNWDAFYRAVGDTRPIAVVAVASFVALVATATPLILVYDLEGFAVAIALMTLVSLTLRWHYLTKLFPSLEILVYTARAIAPTIPAAATVLLVRLLEGGPRTPGTALAELALYLVITAVLTFVLERPLLREVIGYLRRQVPAP